MSRLMVAWVTLVAPGRQQVRKLLLVLDVAPRHELADLPVASLAAPRGDVPSLAALPGRPHHGGDYTDRPGRGRTARRSVEAQPGCRAARAPGRPARRRAADHVAPRDRPVDPTARRGRPPAMSVRPASSWATGSSLSASACGSRRPPGARPTPRSSASRTSPPEDLVRVAECDAELRQRVRAPRPRSAPPFPTAAAIRASSTSSLAIDAGQDRERSAEDPHALEQRRLVLLEVALVAERQALEQRPGSR